MIKRISGILFILLLTFGFLPLPMSTSAATSAVFKVEKIYLAYDGDNGNAGEIEFDTWDGDPSIGSYEDSLSHIACGGLTQPGKEIDISDRSFDIDNVGAPFQYTFKMIDDDGIWGSTLLLTLKISISSSSTVGDYLSTTGQTGTSFSSDGVNVYVEYANGDSSYCWGGQRVGYNAVKWRITVS